MDNQGERRRQPEDSEQLWALRRMMIALVVFWSVIGAALAIYGMLRDTGVAP